ncbi:uncharacterized protein LOC142228510 [Haematobia irritans]|uniref:uncharacterized protein LOC142228510 n=1 Tax=Haematobia irritans TaxID=7368 RepID=UPI003F502A37
MSHPCNICENLHEESNGSAPNRQNFQQPTMYDHFASYQSFKQLKAVQTKISREYEENYTETVKQKLNPSSDTKEVLEKKIPSDTKKKSLLSIIPIPVLCPIKDCNCSISSTSLFQHYLLDHHKPLGVKCQEIYLGNSIRLMFYPNDIEYGKNICLGILAYGGNAGDGASRPAKRGICRPNSFLSKEHIKLANHLPILVMMHRTSWSALLSQKSKSKISYPVELQILIIWLTSAETTKPIHCTVTAYDKFMSSSRSSIVMIRNLNGSQIPKEFILNDIDYLRLNYGDIEILSCKRKEPIFLEFIMNEYDDDLNEQILEK